MTEKNTVEVQSKVDSLEDSASSGGTQQIKYRPASNTLLISYVCLVLGFFTAGLGTLVGVILSHLRKGDFPEGSFEHSHYRHIQRSFWFAILWSVLAIPTVFIGIGFVVLYLVPFWYLYRVVKGCLWYSDGKLMYVTE